MPNASILAPDDGHAVPNPVGGSLVFKVRAAESSGSLTALVTTAAPGEGPPLHTHAAEDESLLVLSGRFRFRIGEEVHDAPVGALMFVARGVAHTWQNVSDEPAQMFVTFTPGSPGMERFFEQFAARVAAEPGPAVFASLAPASGMAVEGPPLAVSHAR